LHKKDDCVTLHGMAYVRRRITKAGEFSTALVEAYRDDQGRPRQRLLVNMHGEPDILRALARLAVQATLVTDQRQLAVIRREQAILKQHCSATRQQIQAATRAYKRELDETITALMEAGSVAVQHDQRSKKLMLKVRRMRGTLLGTFSRPV
jgi:hypothetical protein